MWGNLPCMDQIHRWVSCCRFCMGWAASRGQAHSAKLAIWQAAVGRGRAILAGAWTARNSGVSQFLPAVAFEFSGGNFISVTTKTTGRPSLCGAEDTKSGKIVRSFRRGETRVHGRRRGRKAGGNLCRSHYPGFAVKTGKGKKLWPSGRASRNTCKYSRLPDSAMIRFLMCVIRWGNGSAADRGADCKTASPTPFPAADVPADSSSWLLIREAITNPEIPETHRTVVGYGQGRVREWRIQRSRGTC